MKRSARVLSTAATAVFALGGLLFAGPAAVAGSHRQGAATGTATTAFGARTHVVRLITGDAVSVTTRPGRPAGIAVLNRDRTEYLCERVSSGTYVVPTAAARYLDTVLDRALFDVTHPAGDQGSTLALAVRAGTSPRVPGLTITSRSGTTWHGRFDAAGARRFGAALQQQARRDAAAHRVSRVLFGGVTRITAPHVAAQRTQVRPAFPQHTLTLRVIGPDGKQADGAIVTLGNVDDARRFRNFITVYGGVAKISVPDGTYSGIAEYDTFRGDSARYYFEPVEQHLVNAQHGVITFDERKATNVSTISTPKPAESQGATIEWDRTGAAGDYGVGVSFGTNPTDVIRVGASSPATKGMLDFYTDWELSGSPESGLPFTYNLSYDDKVRIPADQHRTVDPSRLAVVDAHYYSDAPSRPAYLGTGAAHNGGSFVNLPPVNAPFERTEYYYGPTDVAWATTYLPYATDQTPFQGATTDDLAVHPAGSNTRVDWLRGPLAPGVVGPGPGDPYFFCLYCRDAKTMLLALDPFTDTTPAHSGSLELPSEHAVIGRFLLYRNGKRIVDQANSSGAELTVPTSAATYRAVSSTERGKVGFATSTTAVTDLTFRSSATSGRSTPKGWQCPTRGAACSVLPILTTRVLLPTSLDGVVAQGSVPLTFGVGHATGAADPTISKVGFAVTYDGGKTYHALPVTAAGHHAYTTVLQNPATSAGHPVGIRITAVDAAGGKITQTVQAAYVVAGS